MLALRGSDSFSRDQQGITGAPQKVAHSFWSGTKYFVTLALVSSTLTVHEKIGCAGVIYLCILAYLMFPYFLLSESSAGKSIRRQSKVCDCSDGVVLFFLPTHSEKTICCVVALQYVHCTILKSNLVYSAALFHIVQFTQAIDLWRRYRSHDWWCKLLIAFVVVCATCWQPPFVICFLHGWLFHPWVTLNCRSSKCCFQCVMTGCKAHRNIWCRDSTVGRRRFRPSGDGCCYDLIHDEREGSVVGCW